MSNNDRQLPPDLARRVLVRLGFAVPPPLDLDGLSAVYRAWCTRVPFDNTRKMIALRTGAGGPLPGVHADDFFESWLAHGTGGTCWPSSNALFALLEAARFAARRVAGSMRDLGVVSHASVKVRIDGRDWLVDSSMLLNTPLPLGADVHRGDDPVWPVEVEATDGTHVIWWQTPPNAAYMPCRLLLDPASFQECLDGYERSRGRSPFNQRLYARINRPGELVIMLGHTRFSRTAAGVLSRDLTADELLQALREDIGLSDDIVAAWAARGALEASFEPLAGPPPPPETRLPPSMRQPDNFSGVVGRSV
jgi:N-hydroxyarylamine O-acetyltransferase